jgi:hypothetical protein
MAARRPHANPEDTWRIYSALAVEARVSRPVRVDDPRVLVGSLRTGAEHTAIFVNQSPVPVAAEPIVAKSIALGVTGPIELDPFGVALARWTRAAKDAPPPALQASIPERRDAPA